MLGKCSTSKAPELATRATSGPPSSSTPRNGAIPAPAAQQSSRVPEMRSSVWVVSTMFCLKYTRPPTGISCRARSVLLPATVALDTPVSCSGVTRKSWATFCSSVMVASRRSTVSWGSEDDAPSGSSTGSSAAWSVPAESLIVGTLSAGSFWLAVFWQPARLSAPRLSAAQTPRLEMFLIRPPIVMQEHKRDRAPMRRQRFNAWLYPASRPDAGRPWSCPETGSRILPFWSAEAANTGPRLHASRIACRVRRVERGGPGIGAAHGPACATARPRWMARLVRYSALR